MKKWLLLIIVLIILPTGQTSAVVDSDIWNSKTTNSAKKAWTITFNMPVNQKSASNETIFVLDESNKRFPTTITISEDGLRVTISPDRTYELNRQYRLFIDRTVRSTSSKDLKSNIIMPFTVVPMPVDKKETSTESSKEEQKDSSSPLQITVTLNEYVSDITVIATDHVTDVLIGRHKMHYSGNNTFSLGLADVKQGDLLHIKAYDYKKKLFAQERYKVE